MLPRYLNQAITFTGDDMGGDKAMMIMLLYIIMVIMAFVFGITISKNNDTEKKPVLSVPYVRPDIPDRN